MMKNMMIALLVAGTLLVPVAAAHYYNGPYPADCNNGLFHYHLKNGVFYCVSAGPASSHDIQEIIEGGSALP